MSQDIRTTVKRGRVRGRGRGRLVASSSKKPVTRGSLKKSTIHWLNIILKTDVCSDSTINNC